MQNLSGTGLPLLEGVQASQHFSKVTKFLPPRHFVRLSEMEIKFSPKMNGGRGESNLFLGRATANSALLVRLVVNETLQPRSILGTI